MIYNEKILQLLQRRIRSDTEINMNKMYVFLWWNDYFNNTKVTFVRSDVNSAILIWKMINYKKIIKTETIIKCNKAEDGHENGHEWQWEQAIYISFDFTWR